MNKRSFTQHTFSKFWQHLLVIVMMMPCLLTAQEKEAIGISGGLTAGGELYDVHGIANRRSPYSYQINGRVVFSYRDFSLPISGSYRDAQLSYDFTFNHLGIAPTYKWIKVYLGWNSIHFSPYTMAGRMFSGIGVELTPGDFTFTAMKGKIQNPLAIRDTLLNGASLIPTYDRQITGGKIGFAKNKNRVELIFLRMYDDLNSFTPTDDTDPIGYQVLSPKENLVLGFNGGFSLFHKLDFYFNTGASAFTADATDTLLLEYGDEVPNFAQDLFTANSTSKAALAGDVGVNFRLKSVKLGAKYRRVDPFYTTLAATYFMQDVEQYTFNAGTDFMKRKIRVDGQLGFENNNLTSLRSNTTHRVIGNGTLNYMPDEKFYTTLTYSNYSTETENRILLLNDTLRFVSTSATYGLTSQWNHRTDARSVSFTFNAFYNTVLDQSEVEQIGDINILSLSLSNGYQIPSADLTIGPSILFNQYEYDDVVQNRYGGGLRISKRFLDKKINTSLAWTYSVNIYNQARDGNVSYYVLTGSYKLTAKSTISPNISYRVSNSLINASFREFRAFLRYHYNF